MPRSHILSASAALQTLRANPLHSLLSTLGVIIGVASLVAILALAEGMENFGREQIARTTDLQFIQVTPRETESIDGIAMRRSHVAAFAADDSREVRRILQDKGSVALLETSGRPIRLSGDSAIVGAFLYATEPAILDVADGLLTAGRMLSEEDLLEGRQVAVVTDSLAARWTNEPAGLVGRSAVIGERVVEIVGVVTQRSARRPAAFVPMTWDSSSARPVALAVRARSVEEVQEIRTAIETWLDGRFEEGRAAFQIATNEFRVEQVRRGMLLFKIVMGIITGISVMVGGIGIMNVLLVSITERTREIGIRRSTGARRSDIVMQFLAESTALSCTGSLLGLVFGFGGIFLVVPAIRLATEIPFQAAFDWTTVLIVALAALLVGLIFGTYPAYRASRLAPIDALARE